MEITVLGINHKTAPLELRERLSVPFHRTPDLLRRLEEEKIFEERILLSTCNRTEIYGVTRESENSIRLAKGFFSEIARMDLRTFEDKLYSMKQPESVQHLFSVASGLDSMVLGETEITGQVKKAYQSAFENRHTGAVLNNLFQRSFKVAKHLRTYTEIGLGRVSVASVAVGLAEKIFGNLNKIHVMVIGTGEVSSQVAKAMISKQAQCTIVSGYHDDRAVELARTLGAQALRFDRFEEIIPGVDILITCTAAPHAVIRESKVHHWMRERGQRPIFMIDLGLPRNVEHSVEKLDNVYLYNLDDLQALAKKNQVLREGQLEECERRVHQQTQYFMNWFKARAL